MSEEKLNPNRPAEPVKMEPMPPPSALYIAVDALVGVGLLAWSVWLWREQGVYRSLLQGCTGFQCGMHFQQFLLRAVGGPGLIVGFLAAARFSMGKGRERSSTKVPPEIAITVGSVLSSLFVGKALAMVRACGGEDAQHALCNLNVTTQASLGIVLVPGFVYMLLVWIFGQRRQRPQKAAATPPGDKPRIAPPSKGSAPIAARPRPAAKVAERKHTVQPTTMGPVLPEGVKAVDPSKRPKLKAGVKTVNGVRMLEYDEHGDLSTSTNLVAVSVGLAFRCWMVWALMVAIAAAVNFSGCLRAGALLGAASSLGCGRTLSLSIFWFAFAGPIPLIGLVAAVTRAVMLVGPLSRTIAQSIAPLEFISKSVPLGLFSGIWLLICLMFTAEWALPGLRAGLGGTSPAVFGEVEWDGNIGMVEGGELLQIPATITGEITGSKFTGMVERSSGAPLFETLTGRASGDTLYLRSVGSKGWCLEWSRAVATLDGKNLTSSALAFGCHGIAHRNFQGTSTSGAGAGNVVDDLFR